MLSLLWNGQWTIQAEKIVFSLGYFVSAPSRVGIHIILYLAVYGSASNLLAIP